MPWTQTKVTLDLRSDHNQSSRDTCHASWLRLCEGLLPWPARWIHCVLSHWSLQMPSTDCFARWLAPETHAGRGTFFLFFFSFPMYKAFHLISAHLRATQCNPASAAGNTLDRVKVTGNLTQIAHTARVLAFALCLQCPRMLLPLLWDPMSRVSHPCLSEISITSLEEA